MDSLNLSDYTLLAEVESTPPLHNAKPANVEVAREKPEHRVIMYMKLQGWSNREIARKLGYTDAWISQVTRQEWFRHRLLEEMKNSGRTEFVSVLQGEAVNSIDTLILMRDTAASETVRVMCAKDILDRCYGKAVQRVEQKVEFTEKVNEVERLNEEIAELERELAVRTN